MKSYNDVISSSQMGLGCMELSYIEAEQGKEILLKAMEYGVKDLDTATLYADGENEKLLGEVLADNRDKFVVRTKCGVKELGPEMRDSKTFDVISMEQNVDGSMEWIRKSCLDSLKRLNVAKIDIFYLHRLDPKVPIETSMEAFKLLVQEDLIGGIGLSEVGAETIKRAHAIHPIAEVQSDYSICSREVESNGVLATCKERDINFVAYSPLHRGFLTDGMTASTIFDSTDFRIQFGFERFSPENYAKNIAIRERLVSFAQEKKCTLSQLSLAWLMHKGVMVIPGTTSLEHFKSNVESLKVKLSPTDVEWIDSKYPEDIFVGTGYPYCPEEIIKSSKPKEMLHLLAMNSAKEEQAPSDELGAAESKKAIEASTLKC